jgi:hypothetical protein
MKIEMAQQFFIKFYDIKFMTTHPVVFELFHADRHWIANAHINVSNSAVKHMTMSMDNYQKLEARK